MKNMITNTELIKITTKNDQQLVNARELHEFLGIKDHFANWVKYQIDRAMLVENTDYITISEKSENSIRPLIQYHLTLNSAKEIAMLNGGEKGKQGGCYQLKRGG